MRSILILVVVAGCSKDDAARGGAPAPSGANARDAVVEAWKKGGLQPSAMTTTTVEFGKDCQSGTVNNIDVVMCQYATADEAKAAEKPGLAWVGGTTGAAWVSGSVVVAVADRRKADPSGRTINQLMKLAPK